MNAVHAALPPPTPPRARLGLWGRLVLAIAALFVALGAAYALVFVPAIQAALHAQESERLDLHARLVAGHLALGLESGFHELEDLAATDALRGHDRAAIDEALRRADAATQTFLFLYLVDPSGRIEARPDRPERVGEDRSAGDYFWRVARGEARFISDVWVTPLKNWTLTLSVPVRADDGALRGVLVGVLALMDRNPRLYRFVTEPPAGEVCQVSVVTPKGYLIASSRRPDRRPVTCGPQPVVAAPTEPDWLSASARVDAAGWTVIVREPDDVVQARLAGPTRRFAALTLGSLGAAFVIVVLAARGLTHRLVALTSALGRYGREGRAAPIDAAGHDEVAAAARAFNHMLEDRDRAATERAALEERLRAAERLESVGRFASGVAHDLNNLLVPILSYAELLAKDAAPGSERHEWATGVLEVASRARDLSQDVLAYSRAAAPRRAPLALAPLVEEALRVVKGGLSDAIAVRVDLAPDVEVLGDATQLHQVVLNLTVNAAQALGRGQGTIDVRLRREGGRAVLVVADTGCGMDEATRRRAFEPFFSTKESGRGTGLGLAIVQQIVSAHEGQIDVATAPGEGATFTVRLPLLAAARA